MIFLLNIALETWSHIAGVVGLVMTVLSAVLIWRKELLKAGFNQFRDLYITEMLDFKTEIRRYISKSDDAHSRTIKRIAELYEKTHEDVRQQTINCNLIQTKKPLIEEHENEWKAKMENRFDEMRKQITHIENCVNNKGDASSKTRRRRESPGA